MNIKQRRFSNHTLFDFGEDRVEYTLTDQSGSASISVAYEDIPNTPRVFIEKNPWFRNVGIFWVILGLIQTAIYLSDGKYKLSLWFLLGILFYLIYRFATTRYSIYDTCDGKLYIIRNRNHDRIVKELIDRKKVQLAKLYGDLDLTNDPEKEIRKFKWLLSEGVITEAQYNGYLALIQEKHGKDTQGTSPEGLLQ
jgi:hypothetical protein